MLPLCLHNSRILFDINVTYSIVQLPFFCFLRFYDSNIVSQLFPYMGIVFLQVSDFERIAEKESEKFA